MDTWTEADTKSITCILEPRNWKFELILSPHYSRDRVLELLLDRGIDPKYYYAYNKVGQSLFINAMNLIQAKVIRFIHPQPASQIYVKEGERYALINIKLSDGIDELSKTIKDSLQVDPDKYDYMLHHNRKLPRHGQLLCEVRKVFGGDEPDTENTVILRPRSF